MKIGAMNHPAEPLASEIAWMAELKLDFIDLTLEPPAAATWMLSSREVAQWLGDRGLGVVGHTAYYLPIGSSFESVRSAAIDELKRAIEFFAQIGAQWMNVHPDGHAPFCDDATIVQRNVDSLRQLCAFAAKHNIRVMLENVPGRFNSVGQLSPIFDAVGDLGLHLDIGHCNLGVEQSTAGGLLTAFARRLAHVHVHDNRGGHADLHLSLGMGNINFVQHVRELRAADYDGTITLEVFSRDRHYLSYSRDRLRELWDQSIPAVAKSETLARRGV